MSDTSTLTRPTPIPMDPRIRERMVAVKRQEGRKRLRWVLIVSAIVVIAIVGLGITRLPVLAVHHVHVTGDVRTSEATVLSATGLSRHPLMVDINAGRLRQKLEALPWVATAQVRRQWPTTVDVRLTERLPVAQVAGPGGQPALLDVTGRVLAAGSEAAALISPPPGPAAAPPPPAATPAGQRSAQQPAAPAGQQPAQPAPPATATGQPGGPVVVPTVQGLPPVGAPGTSVATVPGLRDGLTLAAALPAALNPAQLAAQQAIVVGDGNLRLTMSPGVTVTFGTADQLANKLLALRTLLDRVSFKGITGIDLRVPDAPVLTGPSQGSTVSTVPRG